MAASSGATAFDVDTNGAAVQRPAVPPADAQDFGVIQQYFVTVDASSIAPFEHPGLNWARNPSQTGIYCLASSADTRGTAEFHPPHGASLFFMRYWGVDSDAENHSVNLTEICQPDFAAGAPVTTSKGTITSAGTPGQFSDSVGISGTVDTQSCTYRLVVTWNAPGGGSCSGSFTQAFYKARVAYFRQISPGPATATFTDVPVGSQFYAEVEALVRSGITSGTTATTYSPNQPVTRLQMAAFLARALGLQFDTIADPANP